MAVSSTLSSTATPLAMLTKLLEIMSFPAKPQAWQTQTVNNKIINEIRNCKY